MPADAADRLAAAAKLRPEQAIDRARAALARLEASGETVTYVKVATAARVSRAWVYTQPDVRAAVDRLRDLNRGSVPVPTRQRASEASLLRRLEAAHARNQDFTRQVTELRDQLATAYRALRENRSSPSPALRLATGDREA